MDSKGVLLLIVRGVLITIKVNTSPPLAFKYESITVPETYEAGQEISLNFRYTNKQLWRT